ncbi:MAG: hypothetical protein E6J91_47430 [Deltaproteobacteria bacterium]|nr:MAG: hypothetical protein E6J91_47430 [Deltaproteobacteria bacterium]
MIVTVERIVPAAVTRAHPAAIALPPHRVLAVCEEPFGAHPQPLYCPVELASPYRDDFEHYERWRALTGDPPALAAFVDDVLRAPDAGAAYRDYVGPTRLAQLCEPEAQAPEPSITAGESPADVNGVERLIVLGARQLAARARAIGARVLIAGIGQAFFAARLAQLQLAAAGYTLRVMVETGLYDVECGAGGHGYLLAYDNVVRARRLSAIDDILGVLACGADNACIAALGAAQIDRHGNLNSTQLGGKLLVGSGGACDIAASVEEVVVLTRLAPGRLVDDVEYITSPGRAVRSVVTDHGVLTRAPAAAGRGPRDETWTITSRRRSPPTRRACSTPWIPPARTASAPDRPDSPIDRCIPTLHTTSGSPAWAATCRRACTTTRRCPRSTSRSRPAISRGSACTAAAGPAAARASPRWP